MAELRWTPQQADALRSTVDTLLVANAGTGKTTTVVGKILWLLGLPFGLEDDSGEPLSPPPENQRAELHEIAAITFTEKAAADLKRQLRARIEASSRTDELRWQIDRASIGTIHSFCGELLREHALRLGIDPTFQVLDENEAWAEQDAVIKELVLERLEEGDPRVAELLQAMSLADGEWNKGVVGHVRDVLRDLRWHRERYERWLLAEDSARRPGPPEWLEEAPPIGDLPGEAGSDEPDESVPDSVLDLDALRAACAEWDDADDLSLATCDTLLHLALEALDRWESFLQEDNARDFDSLILDARELLRGPGGEAAKRGIRDRYRILVIDEFQDTDNAQRDIAFEIGRGVERPQLFLVGDPKQSIYRFRGADVSVWNQVEADFREDGAVLDLSRNFRCAPVIVDFVNRAAGAAMVSTGETLAEEEPGSRVRYATLQAGLEGDEAAAVEWLEVDEETAAETRDAEARHVASRILELVDHTEIADPDSGQRRPLRFSDCALLYRARTGLEHYETALTRYGIPYFLSGAPHLNERQEILDTLNALRVIRAPRDD
ncbi:MAG: UvrD-helicase domain-containing protein, partial [Acidobacteriota bacterium]